MTLFVESSKELVLELFFLVLGEIQVIDGIAVRLETDDLVVTAHYDGVDRFFKSFFEECAAIWRAMHEHILIQTSLSKKDEGVAYGMAKGEYFEVLSLQVNLEELILDHGFKMKW